MTEPLSWIWVAQIVVIIAAVAAGLLAIMWVLLRGRPTYYVITHEANKSWEDIKAEIEARERTEGRKPQWVYHGTHGQRQNGSRAGGGSSPS